MLTKYIAAAMGHAKYELLEDGEGYFGTVPGLRGLWAQADTLAACREELRSALEDWLLFSLARQQPVARHLGLALADLP